MAIQVNIKNNITIEKPNLKIEPITMKVDTKVNKNVPQDVEIGIQEVEEVSIDLEEYINNKTTLKKEIEKLGINYDAIEDVKVLDDENIEITFSNGVVCKYKVENDNSLTIMSGIGYDEYGNVVYKGEKNSENGLPIAEYYDSATGTLIHKITYYENGNKKLEEYKTEEGYKQAILEYNEEGQKVKVSSFDGTEKEIKTTTTNYSYDTKGTLTDSRIVDYTNLRIINTTYTGEKGNEYKSKETLTDPYGKVLKEWNWDYDNSKVTIKDNTTGETEVQTYDGTTKIKMEYYDANGNLYKTTTPSEMNIENFLSIAEDQIGNQGGEEFWSWYGFNSKQPWCACFVSWVAEQTGVLGTSIPKFAAVSQGSTWFKNNGQWQSSNSGYKPEAGDIIFFGNGTHVGIVEKCENGTVYTIEGNCSDTCGRRSYSISDSSISGYGTPDYS